MSDTTIDDPETKLCYKCREVKPYSDFHVWKKHKTGRADNCKVCSKKITREWYEANKEKKLAANDKYRQANWEKIKHKAYSRLDPNKHKARQAVNNAVRLGKFKKLSCHDCGQTNVNFHHTDGYDKDNWFTGVWLCTKHHAQLHKELRWKTQ